MLVDVIRPPFPPNANSTETESVKFFMTACVLGGSNFLTCSRLEKEHEKKVNGNSKPCTAYRIHTM
uniref:Uncharacterized protein n=1 Tax=Anguilla anguilla TaxID=7936 RepID=A0A0E9S6G8_ANGAN